MVLVKTVHYITKYKKKKKSIKIFSLSGITNGKYAYSSCQNELSVCEYFKENQKLKNAIRVSIELPPAPPPPPVPLADTPDERYYLNDDTTDFT